MNFKPLHARFLIAIAVGFSAAVVGAAAPALAQPASVPNPCNAVGLTPVQLLPVMPVFFSAAAKSQTGADCLAWQEFIYLNWQADPNNPGNPNPNAQPSSFGTPGDTSATVWESYLEASQVFGTSMISSLAWATKRPAIKTLTRLSKLGDANLQLHGIGQAGDGKWLTDQRGGLAFYEVRLNEDEYAFITTNVFNGSDLTTYSGQLACATQPGTNGRGGLSLPAGNRSGNTDVDCTGQPATYGQNIGTIEIKAAWVALPADGPLNYRYKTAIAQLTDPGGNVMQATIGLVGLHIIHKVPGANQFIWATFEQIDNDPDNNNGNPVAPTLPANPNQQPYGQYTFFNKNCDPAQDKVYHCQANALPGTPCPVGAPPTPGCYPYSAPMQITRLTPVDSTANAVTGYAWSLLPTASVFNYYRLVDVQWPNSPSPVAPSSTVPLTAGDITPADASHIMANTTMETYMQAKNSCMDCHQFAGIAQPSQHGTAIVGGRQVRRVLISRPNAAAAATPAYASDYSFVFSTETNR